MFNINQFMVLGLVQHSHILIKFQASVWDYTPQESVPKFLGGK